MALPIVAHCACAWPVLPIDVHTHSMLPERAGVRLFWEHGCGAEGYIDMRWQAYRAYQAKVQAYNHRPTDVEEEQDELTLARFRIALERVDIVPDLEDVWLEQEERSPETVPEEG